ncbi:MAG: Sulfur carrier protein FdhD, partial [uncultured Acetobacteraceae bacterium]
VAHGSIAVAGPARPRRPAPDAPRFGGGPHRCGRGNQRDGRAASHPVSERPGDRHDDDDPRPAGRLGARLSAQPEHAPARGRGDRGGLRRRTRRRGGADGRAHRLRAEAAQEDTDQRLRPGHRLRRPSGGLLVRAPRARGGGADLLALPTAAPDQHLADLVLGGRRDPRLRTVRAGPAARLHGGRRPAQRGGQDRGVDVPPRHAAGGQDVLHHRAPDLGDGHQDRPHGDPGADLAQRLHRLGRGAGTAGRADPDRPLQGAALPCAGGGGAHRVRRRPPLRGGGEREALAEELPRGHGGGGGGLRCGGL